MKFIKLLTHLFIPHESNNQKAKILHPSSISLIAVFLIAFQIVLSFAHRTFPQVLGYAANIPPSEVIRLTNAQRQASGLSALSENSALDSAALAKGNDMLAKGYWAHFAPDGTSPWSFFLSFGYKYRYAGENLARDFSDPNSAVSAWMNSPTHRENILNPNYKEIGVGVVQGALAGADTTVIVQFFGAPAGGAPAIPVAKAKETSTTAPSAKAIAKVATPAPTVKSTPTPSPTLSPTPSPTPGIAAYSFISPFQTTKGISLGVTGLLLLVLSIDLIVVRRKRIARIGGRTLAHLAFLGMILAVILILKAGQII
jgi:hypothetical protein